MLRIPLRLPLVLTLLLGLGATAVVPAAASARGSLDIGHPGLTAKMSVHGSNGYEIAIESLSHGRVGLSVSKGDVFGLFGGPPVASAAEYVVPGRVSRHGIRANFGRLGLVAVRFHRHGRPTRGGTLPPLHCTGRQPIVEHGRFEGTIRFRGEEAFTRVALSGARGTVVRRFKRSCRLPSGGGGRASARSASRRRERSLSVTALGAAERRQGRTVSLVSLTLESPQKSGEGLALTLVAAKSAERRGRMSIARSTALIGDQGTLLASRPGVEPFTETMVLPNPFAGTGSYREEAGEKPSWTGSLRVGLPGAERVPLTGPGFVVALCRKESLEKVAHCLARVEKVSGPAGRSSIALGRRLLRP
jgi:hypothetical protein